jgi:hypothetical protein
MALQMRRAIDNFSRNNIANILTMTVKKHGRSIAGADFGR